MSATLSSPARANLWLPRLRALLTFQRFDHTIVDGRTQTDVYTSAVPDQEKIEIHKWRKLDSRNLGINRSMIPPASWTVVKILQTSGFEAYLVGGCVRDLILHRTPKDFDVITTASLPQIRRKFYRAIIVGRRFPICIVNIKGSAVEVSSFDTVAKQAEGKDKYLMSHMPKKCDKKDLLFWKNCMHRDFTINSLFFDPFTNKIYDYSNALKDLRSLKLRTLVPAHLSFKEDCARILRALRLAARLSLSFAQDTDFAIRKLSFSISSLSRSRIMMEVNYMLSYGAAEPSIRLLHRYNLLTMLLPFHAAYLTERTSKESGQGSSMLMKLFSNLDLLVSCDRPCDSTLWIAILAFHITLVKHPQDILIVLTFASLLYHGKSNKGVEYAQEYAIKAHIYTPEVIKSSCSLLNEADISKRTARFAELVQNSVDLLSDTNSLMEGMVIFPNYPCDGNVFVSSKMGENVKILVGLKSLLTKRNGLEIDYELLGKGDIRETRFVLGKIILDTLINNDFKENEKLIGRNNDSVRKRQKVDESKYILKEKSSSSSSKLPQTRNEIRVILEDVFKEAKVVKEEESIKDEKVVTDCGRNKKNSEKIEKSNVEKIKERAKLTLSSFFR